MHPVRLLGSTVRFGCGQQHVVLAMRINLSDLLDETNQPPTHSEPTHAAVLAHSGWHSHACGSCLLTLHLQAMPSYFN